MLALTRKRGESIIIGDSCEVVVLGVQGDQVKMGIIAPRSVSVHRKEIFELIQAENRAALSSPGGEQGQKANLSAARQMVKAKE